MSRFARVALATLTVGAAAGAVLAARPYPARTMVRGVTFTYQVTGTASQKQGGMGSMRMKVTMADGNARMEFTEGTANPMMKNGSYMLLQSAERRMLIVNPKDRNAIALDAEGMGMAMGAMADNPMLKVSYTNSSFSYKDVGAGEAILGYPTRKYETQYGTTMEMRILGMKRTQTTQSQTVMWVAKGLKDLADRATFEAWGKSFGSGVRQTNPELAAQMKQFQDEYADGMALRQRTISTMTDEKGKVTVDTVQAEVVELAKTDVDPSLFVLPSNYQVTDMRQAMGALSAAADSAKAECAKLSEEERAKSPACGGAGPGMKDALKGALPGGLFGRKKKP
jgi:hypothetical protein